MTIRPDRNFTGERGVPLEAAYEALLRHPYDSWRATNQQVYAALREHIAWMHDCCEESVQRYFEEKVAKDA